MKCTICRSETHRHACDACLSTTRRRLREIEMYNAWLRTDDMLMPTHSGSGRRSPGYGSRPPLRLDVIAMTDPRSSLEPPDVDEDRGIGIDTDDQTLPIRDTLHVLANHVRAAQGHQQPTRAGIVLDIGYLLGHLEWCATQPGVAEFAENIRQLHAQARAIAHDQPPGPLGTCLVVGCGGEVYPPPPRRDTTHCPRCRRPYTGLDLVRLRTQEAR